MPPQRISTDIFQMLIINIIVQIFNLPESLLGTSISIPLPSIIPDKLCPLIEIIFVTKEPLEDLGVSNCSIRKGCLDNIHTKQKLMALEPPSPRPRWHAICWLLRCFCGIDLYGYVIVGWVKGSMYLNAGTRTPSVSLGPPASRRRTFGAVAVFASLLARTEPEVPPVYG
jgi:hypothetical protein